MSRSKTATRMRKLVSQYHDSGQSKKDFAASAGITEGKLYYWVSKLSKSRKNSFSEPAASFIPLEVSSKESGAIILIRCTNGIEIEIPV